MPYFPPANGGGGIAIGDPVTGGVAGSIFFAGVGGVFAQDPGFLNYDNTDNQLILGVGSAPKPSMSFGDDGTGLYRGATLDSVNIATAGIARWGVTAAGHLLAAADGQFDFGSPAALRPRDGYFSRDLYASNTLRVGSGAAASLTLQILANRGALTANGTAGVFGFLMQATGTQPTSGAHIFMAMNPISSTGQTASTEIPGFNWATYTKSWATGAITNQREFTINAPTYNFTAASTITNAATLYVSGAPLSGANCTITNEFAAWFGAKLRIDGSQRALGGSGTATLGTIGASGPTATAQTDWIEIGTSSGKRFIPCWS